jgi:hypothetical protein
MKTQILFAYKDIVDDVVSEPEREEQLRSFLEAAYSGETAVLGLLRQLMTFTPESAFSWLHAPGARHAYRSLEIAVALPDELAFELLWAASTSSQPLIPYDFRALAFEEILNGVAEGRFKLSVEDIHSLERLAETRPWRWRGDVEKLALPTDGIDHLFEIPNSTDGKLAILRRAVEEGVSRQISVLSGRFLRLTGRWAPDEETLQGLRNREVETSVETDAGCALVKGSDYLVPWDHILDCGLTLAELSRLILLSDDLQLPVPLQRLTLLAAYRACFKTSGRSIVGLKAGVFHVEHGTLAAPSYFYMGRDAALGKGCVIDNVGGAIVLSGAFLGGGFMPVLIHTHKHQRRMGEFAIKERQFIKPGIFVALAGYRLPMSNPGILEMTDFIGGEPPFPGMTCKPIDPQISVSHRRIQL